MKIELTSISMTVDSASIRRIRVEPKVKQAMMDAASDPESIADFPRTVAMKALQKFSEYYHRRNKPLVEDHYYDKMEEVLKKKYPRHSFWKQSGAKAVGNKRPDVPLPGPMPGLHHRKSGTKQLEDFFTVRSYLIMDKLDGISLQIVYENGVPTEAYTRGDSTKGKDVSYVLSSLKIPRRIPTKKRFIIRAEAIIKPSVFDAKHNSHTAKNGKFKAARNMAGGFLNKQPTSKDYAEYKKYGRDIDVICYEILEGAGTATISKQLALLKRYKFDVVWHKKVDASVKDQLSEIYSQRIAKSDYEIDGIVVMKEVSYVRRSTLPKHAFKFKENSEAAMKIVPVQSVNWEISRNGSIIPTVSIKPIRLGGVQVSNFLGHSLFFIENGFKKADAKLKKPVRAIGPGAKIKVVRSGNVIPYIVEVVKAAPRGPALPDVDYDRSGVHAVYRGTGTGADSLRKVKKLTHFFVKLGMDGFKQSAFQKLFDAGYKTPLKVKRATTQKLNKIEGFGNVNARTLPGEVARVLNKPDFAAFVAASGYMPKFGQDRVQMIVDQYPQILRWKGKSSTFIKNKVLAVKGFKQLADEFAAGLPRVFKLADQLDVKLSITKKAAPTGSKLEGVYITFTGVRDKELQTTIEAEGGTVQSMKANTNLLLIKDESYSNKKTEKAEADGISVMTVDSFRSKYGL